jgi:hypothetical protein
VHGSKKSKVEAGPWKAGTHGSARLSQHHLVTRTRKLYLSRSSDWSSHLNQPGVSPLSNLILAMSTATMPALDNVSYAPTVVDSTGDTKEKARRSSSPTPSTAKGEAADTQRDGHPAEQPVADRESRYLTGRKLAIVFTCVHACHLSCGVLSSCADVGHVCYQRLLAQYLPSRPGKLILSPRHSSCVIDPSCRTKRLFVPKTITIISTAAQTKV